MTDVGRSMALDVGERRIGVALSDPLGLLARALTTVTRQTTAQAVAAIVALVEEWTPTKLVVGLPRNMDDTLGPQAERVQAFARALASHLSVPLVFWDERLSTVSASAILQGQGVRAQDQKGRLDAVAGSLPNLSYLGKQRGETFALLQPATFGEHKYFAWVMRKDAESASFVAAVNDALKKMTADGRVKAIQEKWLGSYTELPLDVPAK
jgi:putative transcription antitermination factor YqgF